MPRRWIALCQAIFLAYLVQSIHPNIVFGQNGSPIIEAVTADFPPFVYTEHHQVKGVVAEIAKRIFEKSHQQVNIKVLPWSRAYQTALSRPNTVIFPLSKVPARESSFFWIGPVISGKTALYALKKRTDLHNISLAQARQLKTGTIRNDVRTLLLKESGFMQVEETANSQANAKKLLLGWIDLWAEEERTVAYLLKQLGYSPEETVVRVLPLGIESKGYLGFSKDSDPKIVRTVDEAFQIFRNSSEYWQILNTYRFLQ